jgi:hypothetical protein
LQTDEREQAFRRRAVDLLWDPERYAVLGESDRYLGPDSFCGRCPSCGGRLNVRFYEGEDVGLKCFNRDCRTDEAKEN